MPVPDSVATFGGPALAVIGDVHGRADLLAPLLDALGDRPILFLGDLVDRGPDARECLALAAETIAARPGSLALMGNHEDMMLAAIRPQARDEDPDRKDGGRCADSHAALKLWLPQGGSETLRSFGISPTLLPRALRAAANEHAAAFDEIAARPLMAWGEGAASGLVFVHAGVDPTRPLDAQEEWDLIWIREPFLSWPHGLDRRVVHGHTIEGRRPRLLDHRIGLDTGAFATGVLTALVIEEGEPMRFLAARRASLDRPVEMGPIEPVTP